MFCAEDRQDAALRCKHCGADLAAAVAKARAAVKEAKNEKKDAKGFAILGALPFVGIAFWAFKTVGIKYATLAGVFGVLYLVIGPWMYKTANQYRKDVKPNVIIGTSFSNYTDQLLFWQLGLYRGQQVRCGPTCARSTPVQVEPPACVDTPEGGLTGIITTTGEDQ